MSAIGRSVWLASGVLGVELFALAGPMGCSSGGAGLGSGIEEQPSSFAGKTAAGGAPSSSTGGALSSAGSFVLTDTGGTSTNASGGQAGVGGGCAATFVQAKLKTLAMFVMLDQSYSMGTRLEGGTTRWAAVTDAFGAFVKNPLTADFPVGLQYFGLPLGNGGSGGAGAGGTGGSGGGAAGAGGGRPRNPIGGRPVDSSCVVNDYAVAEVAIAPLSMNSQAIIDSMAAHGPLTDTPTLPAVQGGIQFAARYATEHPDYKVVLVLATDGEPQGCESTVDNVRAAAEAGLNGTPSIQTYVIGVGQNLTNLDAIALAGGTQHAFLVNDSNVQQDLLDALTAIRGAEVPCEYSVPVPSAGKDLDFGKVNVQYTPATGMPQVLQKVEKASDCPASGGYWYYDDNAAPQRIMLCEDACEQLTRAGQGKVDIVLDCKETIVKPPT